MKVDLSEIYSEICRDIQNSDFVLIGIGEEMQYDWNMMSKNIRYNEIADLPETQHIIPFCQKYIIERFHEKKTDTAYDNLFKLICGKNYFIVSTIIDDIIYSHSGFDDERIVTPCGGYRQLQCSANCTHETQKVPEKFISEVKEYFEERTDKIPEPLKCKNCGRQLTVNQIGVQNYAEEVYISQWKKYLEWLQKTVNHSICIIEIGESLRFPTVVRIPFEKTAMYNLKSRFYRINENFYQINDDAAERSVPVGCNALEFMYEFELPEGYNEQKR